MLKNLVAKRRPIAIVLAGILLVLWVLYWIFGSSENKVTLLVLTPVMPYVIYGFMRLLFKVCMINAPWKYMKFLIYFFLIMATFIGIMDMISFITDFPNGLSPSLAACFGVMIAVLDEARKGIESNESK